MGNTSITVHVEELSKRHFQQVDELFKIAFGFEEDLDAKLQQSKLLGQCTSCVAVLDVPADNKLYVDMNGHAVGLYIMYSPTAWKPSDFPLEFSVDKYSLPLDQLAFCEAAVVHPRMQRMGIGRLMYEWSIQAVKNVAPNVKGFITQVWMESASALPFAESNGSRVIKTHPNAWRQYYLDCGLECNHCKGLCCCTSAECETLL